MAWPSGGYRPRLSLDGFASSAGLHPEVVRRLVTLGLIQATRDGPGELWFTRAELVTVARIQRLRAGLSLNDAAIGLVLDLLDRIAVLPGRCASATPALLRWAEEVIAKPAA